VGYSSSDREILRDALLSILREGLLRIRARGWDGDAEQCAIETDHLHNVPELIRTLKPELLRYYYEIERPAYLSRVKTAQFFEPHWNQIGALLKRRERRNWRLWWKATPRKIRP
jgi:hypothetical protein